MCGIAGEIRFDERPVDSGVLVAMRDRLYHRGPDSEGTYIAPSGAAGLGFRRLRIIDLTPNASQPMGNEDGSVQVVFNGEIYNFRELRERLTARGHRFRSRSDTETIVHSYEESGADSVVGLDGMFAIAIWDDRTQQLTLARDRAGKKPLFWYRSDRFLLFASEIKSFFAHPAVQLDIDYEAVPSYLAHGYVPHPATFYKNVRQVPPGTLMTVDRDGRTTSRRYWQLESPPAAKVPPVPPAAAIAGVRDRLARAVERRLVSDVPLGAFLSGGIDSTIVVGLMAQSTGSRVKTFSIGFEGDAAYDETAYARLAAARFNTEHTEFRVAPSAIDLIDTLVWHHDGPFADSSAIPTYLVSKLTRQHVTVVLTGDGGDEVFAGYRRFRAAIAADRLPRSAVELARRMASRFATPAHERHWAADLRRFLDGASRPLLERSALWSGVFGDDARALLKPDLARAVPVRSLTAHLADELPRIDGRTSLTQLLHANFVSYLADDLLVKTDRCTMAHALEARSPFLDRELIEYAHALPDSFKLRGRRTKVVLREAFADLLPPAINRRGKMGFGVPVGTWFRTSLRAYADEVLRPAHTKYREFLDGAAVVRLLDQHQAGLANLGPQLWTLICFERWLQLLADWRGQRQVSPVAVSSLQ